jgi:hypothetical protein
MKTITTMLVAASLLFASCDKKEDAVTENGVVIQVNDATGCAFIINLDSGKRIEPINQETEKIQPFMVNNRRVSVNYRIRKDFVTPCQNADAAEIIDIKTVAQ